MIRVVSIIFLVGFIGLGCTNSKPSKENKPNHEEVKLENSSSKKGVNMKLEINMIVTDAKEAAEYYKRLLNAEIVSKTNLEAGMNETMMKLGGVDIRVLDENKDLGLFAPKEGSMQSMCINLFVEDIDEFFENVVKEGCKVLSPVQEFQHNNAKNAVFADKFNFVWVVNQL